MDSDGPHKNLDHKIIGMSSTMQPLEPPQIGLAGADFRDQMAVIELKEFLKNAHIQSI